MNEASPAKSRQTVTVRAVVARGSSKNGDSVAIEADRQMSARGVAHHEALVCQHPRQLPKVLLHRGFLSWRVKSRSLGRLWQRRPKHELPAVALLSRAPASLGRKFTVALLAAPALFGLLLLAVLLDAASSVGVRTAVLGRGLDVGGQRCHLFHLLSSWSEALDGLRCNHGGVTVRQRQRPGPKTRGVCDGVRQVGGR